MAGGRYANNAGTEARSLAAAIVVGISCAELDLGLTIPVPVKVAENATLHKLVAAALADMAAAVGTGAVLAYDNYIDPFERLERMRSLHDCAGSGTRIKQVPVYMLCASCRAKARAPTTAESPSAPPVVEAVEVSTQTQTTVTVEHCDVKEAARGVFGRRAESTPPTPTSAASKLSPLKGLRKSPGNLGAGLSLPADAGKAVSSTASPMWKVSTGLQGSCFGSPSPLASCGTPSNYGNSPSRGRQLGASPGGGAVSSRASPHSSSADPFAEFPAAPGARTPGRNTGSGTAIAGADVATVTAIPEFSSDSDVDGALDFDTSTSCPSGRTSRRRSFRARPGSQRSERSLTGNRQVPSHPAVSSSAAAAMDTSGDASMSQSASHADEVITRAASHEPTVGVSSPQLPAVESTSTSPEKGRLRKERLTRSLDIGGFRAHSESGEHAKSSLSFSSDQSRGAECRRQARAMSSGASHSRDSTKEKTGARPDSSHGMPGTNHSSQHSTAMLSQLNMSPDFPEMHPPRLVYKRFQTRSGSCSSIGHQTSATMPLSETCRPVAGFGVDSLRHDRDRSVSRGRSNMSLSGSLSSNMPPRLPPASSPSPPASKSPEPAERDAVQGVGIRHWLERR